MDSPLGMRQNRAIPVLAVLATLNGGSGTYIVVAQSDWQLFFEILTITYWTFLK